MIIENAEVGKVGLIKELDDGSVVQIGLSPEQSEMLQVFIAQISKIKALVVFEEKLIAIPKEDYK